MIDSFSLLYRRQSFRCCKWAVEGDRHHSFELTRDINKPLARDRYGNFKMPPGFILRVNMTSDTIGEKADSHRWKMWEVIRKLYWIPEIGKSEKSVAANITTTVKV